MLTAGHRSTAPLVGTRMLRDLADWAGIRWVFGGGAVGR